MPGRHGRGRRGKVPGGPDGEVHESPYSTNIITYVLVTPKAVTLQRGSVVSVNGTDYAVLLAHVLDPYKNEYEICRTEDL